jgi:hypothetical protein
MVLKPADERAVSLPNSPSPLPSQIYKTGQPRTSLSLPKLALFLSLSKPSRARPNAPHFSPTNHRPSCPSPSLIAPELTRAAPRRPRPRRRLTSAIRGASSEFTARRPNASPEPRRPRQSRRRDRPALLPCRDRLATPPRRALSASSSLILGRATPHHDRTPPFTTRLKATQIFLLTPKSQFELIHQFGNYFLCFGIL